MSEPILGPLIALTGELREGGVPVGTGQVQDALRALAAVDLASREQARLALRSVLCSRHGDLAVFDAAFARTFAAAEEPSRRGQPPLPAGGALALPRLAAPPTAPAARGTLRPAAWSEVALSVDKDFATYTDAERVAARAVIAGLARRGPQRPSRRLRAARRRSTHLDLQRTLRASLRSGGVPLQRSWRSPGVRPRPLVLVCDVSGSMVPYARMLVQYLHAAVAGHGRVEAFVFGTRLTRLTRELAERDPDLALARAAAAMDDWSGGTRIGAALAELNRRHGRQLGRGAVVVILSDGWDRGDPQRLAAEMARLRRSAHRVVWLNPLKAQADYQPLARGMAAALPHVDAFLAANSLRSLGQLSTLLQEGIQMTKPEGAMTP